MPTSISTHLRNELRTALPVASRPVRVKLGIMNRIWRMVRKGSLGFGLVAMVSVAGVGRLLAGMLAKGQLSHVLCIGLVTIPLIGLAALLLWSDDETKQ